MIMRCYHIKTTGLDVSLQPKARWLRKGIITKFCGELIENRSCEVSCVQGCALDREQGEVTRIKV